jgi:tetraacyldisaccharide 4'-kinase
MSSLIDKIESIMDEDLGAKLSPMSLMMRVLSTGYEAAVKLLDLGYGRGFLPSKKLHCPVVSIGNLCVGGTGKTPMTIYIAKTFREMGQRVCILSRGYRGNAENAGGIVSDGHRVLLEARGAGDEALMMAKILSDVPVLVGKNRVQSGLQAIAEFHPDVILLDDGFQHRRLFRDIDIVLLDERRPFGNGRLIPAGRLREPPASLIRADAVVFTRSRDNSGQFAGARDVNTILDSLRIPVFHAQHKPFLAERTQHGIRHGNARYYAGGTERLAFLQGKTVFAFSGIARNDDFIATLKTSGARISGTAFFPDHHWYSKKELHRIAASAKGSGADFIVTTQKDDVRVDISINWPADYIVIGVELTLGEDETAFRNFLSEKIFASPVCQTFE